MSKSIKDYKDAMDSIKISDSFYRRTESLLTELPEVKIEKKPVLSSRRITAFISAAAACMMLVFGMRFVIERRNQEIATVTGITEITIETNEETSMPLVDSFEEDALVNDAGVIVGDMPPIPEEESIEYDEAEEEIDEAAPVAQENPSVAQASDDSKKETQSVDSTTPAVTATTQTGTSESHRKENEVPLLSDVNFDYVTVEITPYFNMGNIKSGENPVKKNGSDCKDIIEYISSITQTSHEIGNYSFKSIFSIQIADEDIGLTFYSIYVTDLNTIVITRHDDINGQERFTYGVNAEDYENLKHLLFLQFGSEEDYELFKNLISGK
ncbi:MAG: hypothetical protein ACI4KG_09830 [Oscillospiraceae bacterium]